MQRENKWQERFEEMTTEPHHHYTSVVDVDRLLFEKSNRHLFYDYAYPENEFELDPEKVKQFIQSEIDRAVAERDKEWVNIVKQGGRPSQILNIMLYK